ncbi:MAG TPA: hypothetical protein VKZ94_15250 [Advenella sp.]|nr:hypothetical protein [Advenella sp.]
MKSVALLDASLDASIEGSQARAAFVAVSGGGRCASAQGLVWGAKRNDSVFVVADPPVRGSRDGLGFVGAGQTDRQKSRIYPLETALLQRRFARWRLVPKPAVAGLPKSSDQGLWVKEKKLWDNLLIKLGMSRW